MLGQYRIVAKIGAGGMGVVYRAHDSKLRRDVALKVLPDDIARSAIERDRLQHEALAASALSL
jgi:serine/threonine protein kinase